MEKLLEFFDSFKAFIIKEFLWFFASLFIAILFTLLSFLILEEFSINLSERIEWQGMENNSVYLVLFIFWFVFIYLVRLIRGAILFLTIPKEEEKEED
ncbi:hypothetical protein [Flavivirga jejuensis]|uniref:Uncharacterized protein n=1 Tax=Flavivirga jejuensis TaxID=870487 RepID=A0ABT8WPF7_9FLAO|nr:hypothetical protein [Flavivirga jejuensis]MDO5974905.1 hypothetical protein [Flavivirga jejuensis]